MVEGRLYMYIYIYMGARLETAQRLPCGKKAEWGENYIVKKQTDLYRIPQQLIEEIFQRVGSNL